MKHIRRTCLTLAGTTFLAAPFAPLLAQDSPGPAPGVQDPPKDTPPGKAEEPIFDFGAGQDGQVEGLDFGDMNQPDVTGATQGPTSVVSPTGDGATELVAFNGADISQVLLYLQRLAQRPVQPDSLVLSTAGKITIINSTPLTRTQAMNLVIEALFANRIAVIDRESHLAVVPTANIQEGMVPVVGPEEDILGREDRGMVVEKVFQIKYGKASTIKDKIQAQGPPNMKIEVEDASNQIIALYNIGTLQRLQKQIDKLDISGTNLQLETFALKYADADNVAKQIVGVFGQQEDPNQGGRNPNQIFGGGARARPDQGLTTSTQLQVVTDKSRNTVTVRAERDIIEQVAKQIKESWDVKLEGALPLVIELKNSDAVKMAEMLNKIFAQEGEAIEAIQGNFFDFNGGGGRAQQSTSQNAQGEGPKLAPLGGQVSFTADNTKNTLIVTTRSHEYDSMIREFIESLDVPGDVNAPVLYELRYADAEDLANRLNALLAEAGSRVDVERTSEELTQRSNVAQVSQQQSGQQQQQPQQAQAIQFPWQTGSPDPNARKISNLIGQVRIMPIARQNGLLVVAPPELREGMANLIKTLDAPGRQVLIQAIIAEISVDDATSLGIRWGSGNVGSGPNEDNRIVVGSTIEGEKTQLINALFDTSTLGVNVDLNVALQALSQVTNVSVLSRPGIVTSDNEEASFFDGQDIPFITDSSTTNVGGITQSFDYLAVGIQLSVRPHITVEGNVDLRVNLQLSSVVPGQTLFGGSILDRRETTTKVTISDGQTVVISGIRRTVLNDIIRKVPLLGDIPLIGGLFRSTEKSESRTELVAFIRPIILDSPEKIRGTSLEEFKLLNKSRKELEGADVENNPASIEHWNEPMFRDEQNEGTEPSSDDGGPSLPWMQKSPESTPTTGDQTRGSGTVSLARPGTPLPWPQNSSKD